MDGWKKKNFQVLAAVNVLSLYETYSSTVINSKQTITSELKCVFHVKMYVFQHDAACNENEFDT